ncbi:fatty-acid metabolism regulator protein [Actinomadura sp. NBRC 104412]|uniref:FdrA family protein n=1 Tax=Actinomadura sp. NBRC 104412 TaxID=3032203 RepID=UPI00249FCEF4|nr:FdrA family protein [Actinomadura sp. NBRC 104412]GLZ03587.1 fatty-acid metabolism regulator protein [Actinomadura sp. NBRC 104412]
MKWVEVRRGAYHDSVTLMRVSRQVGELAGVDGAMAAMGTRLNLEMLARMGFEAPGDAGPADLVVAVSADGEALDAARRTLDDLLASAGAGPAGNRSGAVPGTLPPARTTGAAARRADAGIALVSVPGPYVFPEAMDALAAGLNVMVFSDNVPLEQEIALKDAAARRGLIVMGPDCGTAVVGGAGLGFANAVRPGPVGLVAASGTGAQQVMCLLDAAGVGVGHALGVGGRDLSLEVSGRSSLAALAALDADPGTELIVLVSKPPAPQVADLVAEAARRLDTPVVFAFPGPEDDLTRATERALRRLGRPVPEWPRWPAAPPARPVTGALRGLFSGGTLRDEAEAIASTAPGGRTGGRTARGHELIDYGDDAYTRGRAHPMIDPTLRLEAIAKQSADPACGVLLLDVVLGYGADPDPAASLAPAIVAALDRRDDLAVVVSLCGTPADPQGRDAQAEALRAAGASVFASNAEAARYAAGLRAGEGTGADG